MCRLAVAACLLALAAQPTAARTLHPGSCTTLRHRAKGGVEKHLQLAERRSPAHEENLAERSCRAWCFICCVVDTENWAQYSGKKLQNSATSAGSPWAARWGHAVAIFLNPQGLGDPIPPSLRTRIFILGGETFNSEMGYNNEFAGTGSYMNDVWTSRGMGKRSCGLHPAPTPCVPLRFQTAALSRPPLLSRILRNVQYGEADALWRASAPRRVPGDVVGNDAVSTRALQRDVRGVAVLRQERQLGLPHTRMRRHHC